MKFVRPWRVRSKTKRRFVVKQLFLFTTLVGVITLLLTSAAIAQELPYIEVANLVPWIKKNPPDWGTGTLFAVLGLIGSLVTIFSLIGGAVPGTAGQAQIDADTERLERLSRRLETLINTAEINSDAIAAVENTVNNLRDDLRSEKWRQFFIATGFYAILGAFFAALLAQDILQALMIGAGWTSFIGTLGMKKDYAERKFIKDEILEEFFNHTKKLEALLKEKDILPQDLGLTSFNASELESKIKIAQRL